MTKNWNDGSGDVLTVTYDGTGDGTVTVSSPANAGNARELTLTLQTAGGSVSRTVTVKQKAEYQNLTFEILTAGTVVWKKGSSSASNKTIQYRKNGGGWTSITANDTTGVSISVAAGDVLEFKGTGAQYASNNTISYSTHFSGTATFNVSGYLDSMIGGKDSVIRANYAFLGMFYECKVVSAEHLVLPALVSGKTYSFSLLFYSCTSLTAAPKLPSTMLADYCYQNMFYGCTALRTAPVLPALTLVSNCYYRIFYKCSKLNYVKAMFTTTPGTSYTNAWLYGVASSGTFVKNSAATWNVSGTSGVPSGWTVERSSN